MSNSVPQYPDLHLQTLKCVFFEAHVQYCYAEGDSDKGGLDRGLKADLRAWILLRSLFLGNL